MATSRICSIPDCGKPHRARGLCMAHYQFRRNHGGPLDDDTHQGKPARFFREVVLAYDGIDCLNWPFAKASGGYGTLWREGKTQLVSRILCEAVNGPPPTPEHEAAHSCGKGHEGCCAKRHLAWKTHMENEADKVAHGTAQIGERHPSAKITEADVHKIRALIGKKPQTAIARQFGISQQVVSDINTGKTWGYIR